MVIDEDVYLEHYGVKGQKWGVRKSKSSNTKTTKPKKKSLTAKEKRVRSEKRIRTAQKVLGTAATAVYAAAFISSMFSSPTSNKKYRIGPCPSYLLYAFV